MSTSNWYRWLSECNVNLLGLDYSELYEAQEKMKQAEKAMEFLSGDASEDAKLVLAAMAARTNLKAVQNKIEAELPKA